MTATWPLLPSLVGLAGSVLALVAIGGRLARTAETLADRLGIGSAVGGAVFLGAVTSLTGILTTITGAVEGEAGYAIANPAGGIAVQTVWLAIADLVYRRANLEHAAASLENLLQSLVLVAMLMVPVVAYATPELTVGWVHPVSILIPALYGYGFVLLRRTRAAPMWSPVKTDDTAEDKKELQEEASTRRLATRLAVLAVIVGAVGWIIGQSGLGVAAATGWSASITGFTVTTLISSLPELVVLIAAIRMGSLTLGVGNIIGGNVFDTLMIPLADAFYFDGPVYAAAGSSSLVLLGGTALMTTVLAGGLLVRERRGIGFEGFAIPAIYLGTIGAAVVAT